MRPTGTAAELERRRLRALTLLKAGRGPTEVAKMVGATRRTVQRWARRGERLGKEGLKAKPHPGRPCRMTARQKRDLSKALLEGPKSHGFSTDLWTRCRIGELIRRRYGVRYHPVHVGRLLHALGWTPQRPERKAYERDERAIRRWLQVDWPRIKKSS